MSNNFVSKLSQHELDVLNKFRKTLSSSESEDMLDIWYLLYIKNMSNSMNFDRVADEFTNEAGKINPKKLDYYLSNLYSFKDFNPKHVNFLVNQRLSTKT